MICEDGHALIEVEVVVFIDIFAEEMGLREQAVPVGKFQHGVRRKLTRRKRNRLKRLVEGKS